VQTAAGHIDAPVSLHKYIAYIWHALSRPYVSVSDHPGSKEHGFCGSSVDYYVLSSCQRDDIIIDRHHELTLTALSTSQCQS